MPVAWVEQERARAERKQRLAVHLERELAALQVEDAKLSAYDLAGGDPPCPHCNDREVAAARARHAKRVKKLMALIDECRTFLAE